jgi:hypothetical protein
VNTPQRDARIVQLQSELFDYTGHVRRGMTKQQGDLLLWELNRLRRENRWDEVSLTGRTKR